MNWRWPKKKDNNCNPWYTMLWRTLWILPVCLFLILTSVIVSIFYGSWKKGSQFYIDNC